MLGAVTLSLLVVLAGWIDWRHRLLPNWLALAIMAVAIAHVIATSGLGELGWHLAHLAIALVVGIALFAIGAIGGGDAKTYAAVAAAVPLSNWHVLLLGTAAALFIVTLGWFAASYIRRIVKQRAETDDAKVADEKYAKVPVGIAIAIGTLNYLWLFNGSGTGWWVA